jgi:hypothetical protein
MNIQNKLKDLKDQKSYSIPAKRIQEHLKPILSKSNELRKRWMWELLQNASDLGNEITAEFELLDNLLIFRHNGEPFTLDQAFNLIMPDSTKDDKSAKSKSVIGQFGTGFISTHILSKKIAVSGVVEDSEEDKYFSFSFNLDRSEREDKNFLIQSIKDSEKEYSKSLIEIEDYSPSDFDTEFVYQIDDSYYPIVGNQIIEDGFDSFRELIPFVFAFRPQLKKINIKDKRKGLDETWVFKRKEVETKIEDLELTVTVCKKNKQKHCTTTIGTIKDYETTIAFQLEEIETNVFRVLEFLENSPKLYCAFPMIGTTEYNFPVVIHSESFVPNRERDGIAISEHDKENRERLVEAKDAFEKLFDIIEEYEWEESFNLCRISKVEMQNEDEKEWYKSEIFNPIKEKIHTTKLIELDASLEVENYRNSLSQVYIPYYDRRASNSKELTEKIYDLAYYIMPKELPKKEHLLSWYNVLDFELFENEKLDIERLVKTVSAGNSNFESFIDDYSMTNDETINYLKDLIQFVIEQEKESLLNDYAIIPNQNNELELQKKLRVDLVTHKNLTDGYDKKLKEINYQLTGEDCKIFLLHKDFEKIENLIDEDKKFDFKELAHQTDDKLRNYEGNFQDEDALLILKDLFHWFTNCGISEETLSSILPYFSLNKSQLYFNTKSAEELEFSFDIEISGKSEILAKIAKSNLSAEDLGIIAENPDLVSSFINWLNHKDQDNPDEELGNIGEEFLNYELCKMFGKERVLWEDKSAYDFRILEKDLISTKYYIDAKTTAKGIGNLENVPFYMRMAQWDFLDKEQAFDKYIIARVYKSNAEFNVKYIKINLKKIK